MVSLGYLCVTSFVFGKLVFPFRPDVPTTNIENSIQPFSSFARGYRGKPLMSGICIAEILYNGTV